MVLSSPIFLSFFLPLLLGLYFLAQKNFRNYLLLAGSLLFYSWGEPKAVFVMAALIVINYAISIPLEKYRHKNSGKLLLALGITINLLSLVFYKYLSFFISGANSIISLWHGTPLPDPSIALPIGISFYIFQIISYLVDIYRGEILVQKKLSSLALYISLFPQLTAGPIVRYQTIAENIENREFNFDNLYHGLRRFAFGLAKKILIADNMAVIADTVFSAPAETIPWLFTWLGVMAYALQIYFDFSGYSDMAIGLGRVFNFRFLENFNFPYSAVSIQDFWRRWHISLSTWFRDYLYIPLGGSRKGNARTYVNLFIVFALCGLWHGAAWTFVFWGVYQGLGLVWERLGINKLIARLPKPLANIYVMLFVLIGWVFFRSGTPPYAFKYLKIMFTGNAAYPLHTFHKALDFISYSNIFVFIIGVLFAYPFISSKFERIANKPSGIIITALLFFVAYIFAMTSSYSPFIYFRF